METDLNEASAEEMENVTDEELEDFTEGEGIFEQKTRGGRKRSSLTEEQKRAYAAITKKLNNLKTDSTVGDIAKKCPSGKWGQCMMNGDITAAEYKKLVDLKDSGKSIKIGDLSGQDISSFVYEGMSGPDQDLSLLIPATFGYGEPGTNFYGTIGQMADAMGVDELTVANNLKARYNWNGDPTTVQAGWTFPR
jgi:hypothetical protein